MLDVPLIDIGVNLTANRLARQAAEVVQRAAAAQVTGLLLTGTSLEVSVECARLTEALASPSSRCELWSTAGIHPHDAEKAQQTHPQWRGELAKLLAHPRVVAVGECGLDFERNYSPPEVQLEVFEAQLQLAVEHQYPLFLHERGAHDAFYQLLERYAPRLPQRDDALAAVVHCFTGDHATLRRYLDLGCFIGVTGWVCDERRGQALQEAVSHLPLERVLIETDAPYLLPRTLRPKPKGGTNEPAFLPHIVEQLARYMGCDANTLAAHATANTLRLFSLTWGERDPELTSTSTLSC